MNNVMYIDGEEVGKISDVQLQAPAGKDVKNIKPGKMECSFEVDLDRKAINRILGIRELTLYLPAFINAPRWLYRFQYSRLWRTSEWVFTAAEGKKHRWFWQVNLTFRKKEFAIIWKRRVRVYKTLFERFFLA